MITTPTSTTERVMLGTGGRSPGCTTGVAWAAKPGGDGVTQFDREDVRWRLR